MTLEGGYDLPAICDCSEECVRALLDGSSSPVSEDELRRHPCQNAIDTLQKTIAIQVISADKRDYKFVQSNLPVEDVV